MPAADYQLRKLLLLSNSRDEAGRFLQHLGDDLSEHLSSVRTITFVPYAGVTISWDAYAHHVREAMTAYGVKLVSVHETDDARAAIHDAEAIAVGGGNTFHLIANVQREQLTDVMRTRVLGGVPYLGWSAGSVIACPTMQTTNDMPITEPASFNALGLVGFQINAHFTDAHPPGFQGETRRQRLAEFVAANAGVSVVGLPEGTWLRVRGNSVVLRGQHDAPRFRLNAADITLARDVELGRGAGILGDVVPANPRLRAAWTILGGHLLHRNCRLYWRISVQLVRENKGRLRRAELNPNGHVPHDQENQRASQQQQAGGSTGSAVRNMKD